MQNEGGSKSIARYLKRDFGVIVSHKKVYRISRKTAYFCDEVKNENSSDCKEATTVWLTLKTKFGNLVSNTAGLTLKKYFLYSGLYRRIYTRD